MAQKYSLPQLRLWARMITGGNHESADDPPQVPAITGITPKREKRESLASALAVLRQRLQVLYLVMKFISPI